MFCLEDSHTQCHFTLYNDSKAVFGFMANHPFIDTIHGINSVSMAAPFQSLVKEFVFAFCDLPK